MKPARLICVAAAAVALAGCGEDDRGVTRPETDELVAGPSTDQAAVQSVLAAEIVALAAGDGDAACELLSAGGEAQVISIINQVAERIERPLDFQDCDAAISATLGGEEPLIPELGRLEQAAGEASVAFEGPEATATIAAGETGEIFVGLEKVDGRWRITTLDELLLGPLEP